LHVLESNAEGERIGAAKAAAKMPVHEGNTFSAMRIAPEPLERAGIVGGQFDINLP